jgi:hypothetical protein
MNKLQEKTNNDLDNDQSEACLSAIKVIVKHCPSEIKDRTQLLSQCMKLMKYDPEYTYNEDSNMA